MFTNFRRHHLLQIFHLFEEEANKPLDFILSHYLRSHKEIGSQDRKFISDSLYEMMRWRETLDAFLGDFPSWEDRCDLFIEKGLKTLLETPSLKPHQQVSFPKPLYDYVIESLGEEDGNLYCLNTNEKAPVTVRVNLLKITRETLYQSWKDLYKVSLCQRAQTGIVFHQKINFHALAEYKQGLFEIQDEASQLIGNLVSPEESDEILDFCAGGGGKSLAIAALMHNKGQLFLHDIREKALLSAKLRLKRAGVQNAQIIYNDPKKMNRLRNRMDTVLLDVPCSGSGTWRRNPDQKYRTEIATIHRLIEEQRAIFKEALPYRKPKGKIVYATCSVFPDENEHQIDYFAKAHGVRPVAPFFKTFPKPGEMDGFFGAILA